MARMPTDDEIQAAGIALGHGRGPYPTKLRAQLAKTIQETKRMAADEAADDTRVGDFAERIGAVHRALYDKLPADVAGAVTAAVAPTVYRDTK